MSQNGFIGESDGLFPRKWDRSRWSLFIEIDRTFDTIKVTLLGYGGTQPQMMGIEGPLQRPCASWEHVYEHAITSLRDQLEIQLNDAL